MPVLGTDARRRAWRRMGDITAATAHDLAGSGTGSIPALKPAAGASKPMRLSQKSRLGMANGELFVMG